MPSDYSLIRESYWSVYGGYGGLSAGWLISDSIKIASHKLPLFIIFLTLVILKKFKNYLKLKDICLDKEQDCDTSLASGSDAVADLNCFEGMV